MRGVLIVLLSFLVLTTPTFAGSTAVIESVRPLQSPIEDEETGESILRNICTVTSINAEEHYWLTAGHCLEPEMLIANHVATVVFRDEAADLMVLHTANYSRPALALRQTAPAVEDQVLMAGHPQGLGSIQVFHGHISSLLTQLGDGAYTMFDMTACGGNSGSAIVDANDQVVSVLQVGFGRPCSTFSGGAPWSVVSELVGKYFGK